MPFRIAPPRRIKKGPIFAATVGLLSLGVALAGCPGELENPERFAPSTASGTGGGGGNGGAGGGGDNCDVPTLIFAQTCANMPNCHSSETPSAGLDLVSPGFEDRVRNKASSTDEACTGSVLADPNDPEGSLLYTKTLNPAPCGLRMPLGGPYLDAEQTQCLLDWIAGLGDGAGGGGGAGGAGGAGGGGGAGGAGTGGSPGTGGAGGAGGAGGS